MLQGIHHQSIYLSHNLTAPVEHRSENLRGHDKTGGAGVDGDVTSHQTHVTKLLVKFSVLLITQSLKKKDRLLVDKLTPPTFKSTEFCLV